MCWQISVNKQNRFWTTLYILPLHRNMLILHVYWSCYMLCWSFFFGVVWFIWDRSDPQNYPLPSIGYWVRFFYNIKTNKLSQSYQGNGHLLNKKAMLIQYLILDPIDCNRININNKCLEKCWKIDLKTICWSICASFLTWNRSHLCQYVIPRMVL